MCSGYFAMPPQPRATPARHQRHPRGCPVSHSPDTATLRALLRQAIPNPTGPAAVTTTGERTLDVIAENDGYGVHIASVGNVYWPGTHNTANLLAALVNAASGLLDAADERDRYRAALERIRDRDKATSADRYLWVEDPTDPTVCRGCDSIEIASGALHDHFGDNGTCFECGAPADGGAR
jgi:hypothetical protein